MLSPRQVEIARHLCLGRSTKEIARRLGLSHRTVQNYIHSAGKRLGGLGTPIKRLIVWYICVHGPPMNVE